MGLDYPWDWTPIPYLDNPGIGLKIRRWLIFNPVNNCWRIKNSPHSLSSHTKQSRAAPDSSEHVFILTIWQTKSKTHLHGCWPETEASEHRKPIFIERRCRWRRRRADLDWSKRASSAGFRFLLHLHLTGDRIVLPIASFYQFLLHLHLTGKSQGLCFMLNLDVICNNMEKILEAVTTKRGVDTKFIGDELKKMGYSVYDRARLLKLFGDQPINVDIFKSFDTMEEREEFVLSLYSGL